MDAWLNPIPAKLADLYAILDDRERPYYEHRMASVTCVVASAASSSTHAMAAGAVIGREAQCIGIFNQNNRGVTNDRKSRTLPLRRCEFQACHRASANPCLLVP
jgi:hypothetical protein